MSDAFKYADLNVGAVKADLIAKVKGWEQEHFQNSVNAQLAEARFNAASTLEEEDAVRKEWQAALDNMAANQAAIKQARTILAGLKGENKTAVTPLTVSDPPPEPDVAAADEPV